MPELPGAAVLPELPDPEVPVPLYPPGPPAILPVLAEPEFPPGAVATTEPVVPEPAPGATVVPLGAPEPPGFTTVTLFPLVVPVVPLAPGAAPVDGVDVPVVTFEPTVVLPVGEL